MRAKAYAVQDSKAPLELWEFDRREPLDDDVEIAIEYSGICHSDIHHARGDWGEVPYPSVPGHEIIGTVTRVGRNVSRFTEGQRVGVGVMVNSCGECSACGEGYENYCENGFTGTYGAQDPLDGSVTRGGYSNIITVTQKFVFDIPEELDPAGAAPLLCAGITMYSPLKHWKAGTGVRVGIAGLGGLGHMGVKIAAAMGAQVDVITRNPQKAEAAKTYGASEIVDSTNEAEVSNAKRRYDLIVSTVPVEHDVTPYLDMLAINGVLCLVGAINPMPAYHGTQVIAGRKSIAGSGIGSVAETEEMLRFCAEHKVLPEIEVIRFDQANKAWETMQSAEMDRRYVIDVANSFG